MKKEVFDNFYNVFHIDEIVTKNQISEYLATFFDVLKETTLSWRIYDLKEGRYIVSISNGMYKVLDVDKYKEFVVEVDVKLMDCLKSYNKEMIHFRRESEEYLNTNVSVWNTSLLNKYTVHQVYKTYNIVEVDRYRVTQLYYFLKDTFGSEQVLKDLNLPEYYYESAEMIVRRLPLKSPLMSKKSSMDMFVTTPKAEKILVDVIIYNKSILPYDLSEIENIYRNIYRKHVVKTSTVLNYARIRGAKVRREVENMLYTIGELSNDR